MAAALAACLTVACDDGGGGEARGLDAGAGDDASATGDSSVLMAWDSAEGGTGPQGDAGAIPDAGPPPCFADGRELIPSYTSDPIEGLVGVRADVDPNGDGAADILLTIRSNETSELRFLDGRTADPLGGVVGAPGSELRYFPGRWPPREQVGPMQLDGAPVLVVLEQPEGDAPGKLRVITAEGLDDRYEIPLGARAAEITLTESGLALVQYADAEGSCAVFGLIAAGAGGAVLPKAGGCRLSPAWDANGDGQVDLLRIGLQGTTLFDGATMEPIAHLEGKAVSLGFVPADGTAGDAAPGPTNVRGRGLELPGIEPANEGGFGQLFLRYHSPESLRITEEGQPVSGIFVRAEMWWTAGGLRALAEENRGGLRYLHIFDPETWRLRGEYGPYRNLIWGGGADIDGDGFGEIWMVTGPSPDGVADEVRFRRATDGEEVLLINDERGARFDPIFVRRGPFLRLADLDGCEGDELVVLRSGATTDGERPTRVLVLDADGAPLLQGEPRTGAVHSLAIGDLDGEPPFELLEVRSDSNRSAQLFVY